MATAATLDALQGWNNEELYDIVGTLVPAVDEAMHRDCMVDLQHLIAASADPCSLEEAHERSAGRPRPAACGHEEVSAARFGRPRPGGGRQGSAELRMADAAETK